MTALHSQTRQQIRHYTSRLLNDIQTGVATSPASGSFVCTSWEKPDDHFNKWQEVFCYSGTGIGTTGNPTDWVNSTHTLTFLPAATLTTADLVELHRTWTVAEYNDSINMAILSVQREGMQHSVDETIILDDLLTNGTFDSGYTISWTTSGAGATFANESTIKLRGTYSAKVVNGTGVAAFLYQSVSNYPKYVNRNVTAKAWCYCNTASRARIALTDGVNTWYSPYHTGDGWERLSIENKNLDAASTALTVQLRTELGTAITAYWDECWLAPDDHLYEYTVPASMVYIYKLDEDNYTTYSTGANVFPGEFGIDNSCWGILRSTTKKIKFHKDRYTPRAGTVLRVHGLVAPTVLSADTTTTAVNPIYLAYQTAAFLHMSRSGGNSPDSEFHAKQFAFWQGKADQERLKMGVNLPPDSREVEV